MSTYGTIITSNGAAIITDCIQNGNTLLIAEAAAGDGNGAYYQPTVSQTSLLNEKWRGDIAAAEINPNNQNMIDVKIVMEDNTTTFTADWKIN